MNAILSRRKKGAVILAILVIFLMANIVVQSIYVPRVDASAVLTAFLIEHAPAFFTLLLGIGGVVYEDVAGPDFGIPNVAEAFVSFVTNYYDTYMADGIMDVIGSLTNDGAILYGDLPVDVRRAFLEYSIQQANAISIGGEFSYENPWVSRVSATPATGTLTVEDIPSYVGVGFTVEIDRMENGRVTIAHDNYIFDDTDGSTQNRADQWQLIYFGDSTAYDNCFDLQWRKTGVVHSTYHYYSDPYLVYHNSETDYQYLVLQFFDNTLTVYTKTPQGLNEEFMWAPAGGESGWDYAFTGHSDVGMTVSRASVDITSAESAVITSENVIDDGTEWREEHEDELREEVVPPWTDVGTGTITIPVGGIDDLTGEGTTVGDVTTPIDTTVDYPVEYPDTMTGVGDVPLDIPDTVSGNWIENFNFDWSVFTDVTERFPLSIPWDIQRVFALFDHYEAEPPEITFNLSELFPNWNVGSDQEYSISFEFIEPYAEFIRWMLWILMVMSFVIFLLKHYIAQ